MNTYLIDTVDLNQQNYPLFLALFEKCIQGLVQATIDKEILRIKYNLYAIQQIANEIDLFRIKETCNNFDHFLKDQMEDYPKTIQYVSLLTFQIYLYAKYKQNTESEPLLQQLQILQSLEQVETNIRDAPENVQCRLCSFLF
ncbi:hypothetical protein pb186bvf_003867 [Paramecium bursaria]